MLSPPVIEGKILVAAEELVSDHLLRAIMNLVGNVIVPSNVKVYVASIANSLHCARVAEQPL